MLATQTYTGTVQPAGNTLLSASDFVYKGCFRVWPVGPKSLGAAGATIVVDSGKLWMVDGTSNWWAEFNLPATLGATLPTAPVQPMVGEWQDLAPCRVQNPDPKCWGAIKQAGQLLYTIQIYYNANGTDMPCLGWGTNGLWQIEGHSQGQAGHIGRIPEPWASQYGFSHFCGLAGTTINGASSFGPCITAFNFDPASPPAQGSTIPARKLLYYPLANIFPGFTTTDVIRGVVWKDNGVAFFGTHGDIATWYGSWDGLDDQGNPAVGYTGIPDTCALPKGPHSSRYQPWVWIYNPADFAAVLAGTKQPWEVQPIHEGLFQENVIRRTPGTYDCHRLRSTFYDSANGLMYGTSDDWYAHDLYPTFYGNAVHVWEVK